MSNDKPLKNGHDKTEEAEVHVENPSTIRSRRSKERRKLGIVVLRDVVIEPDLVQALIVNAWLHESERANRESILSAIGAVLYRALSANVSPNSEKATLEIDVSAIRAALPWLKPGTQLDARSAAKAMEVAVRCASQAGFTPQEYGERVKASMGLN